MKIAFLKELMRCQISYIKLIIMAFYKTINKMQSEKKLLNKSKIRIILHLFLSARGFLLVFTNFVVVIN